MNLLTASKNIFYEFYFGMKGEFIMIKIRLNRRRGEEEELCEEGRG